MVKDIDEISENASGRAKSRLESSHHLDVDLSSMEWYFCNQEVGMIPRILIGVLLGGAAGFGLSYLTRGIGSS